MKKQKMPMTVVHPNAGGIDVGSKSHYVAIGQRSEDVKNFGVYAEDLSGLVQWLLENNVTTVAMESTGVYWQNLFVELINAKIEVVLTNGKFTKNINRKKTDVLDCQWIQKLHTLGLLPSSFLPDHITERLRTLCRHRVNMIDQRADTTRKMQKYLKFLNFRLDVVVRDVTGLTGLKIIEGICQGDLDPSSLASYRHPNCRKSEEEIAKALVSNKRQDYLFGLKQEFNRYQFYNQLIDACDQEVSTFLNQVILEREEVVDDIPEEKPHKKQNKNALKGVDLNIISYQYFDGVDLLTIPGVSHSTVLTLMSEIGPEGFKKFPTAKHFAAWLKLAPNNKISGGRVLSNRIPHGSNRLKIALRNSANAVGNLKDSDLAKFFRRIAFKKGRQTAINATARKIAVIIWNMVTKKEPYQPRENYLFAHQKRHLLKKIKKQLKDMGLNPNEMGFTTSNLDKITRELLSDNQTLKLR